MRPFKIGMIAGRFQHIHKLHEFIIRTALHNCDKVLVCVGSAELYGKKKHPFHPIVRVMLIERIFSKEIEEGRLVIYSLPNPPQDFPLDGFAEYLFGACEHYLGSKPNAIFYGNDKIDMKWYKDGDLDGVSCFVISEGVHIDGEYLKCRGTYIRKLIEEGNEEEWKKYTNPAIHNKFWDLHNLLSACEE